MTTPGLDEDGGLDARAELFERQALVAELPVEALAGAGLMRERERHLRCIRASFQ